MAEFAFIDWLLRNAKPDARLSVPIGDDLAALHFPAGDLLLVGVDQVLDGVHFDLTRHSPEAIGRKVMNRNLSDCAAMAALPLAAVVSFALPVGGGIDLAKRLSLGLIEAGSAFDCPIVGGDTASWDGKLAVTVTLLGRSAGITPITRSGAKPGDGLFITGPLGGSILGRHLTFTPRVHLARRLAATGRLTAMIDVSDGLSRDLPHLCHQSGVGAIVPTDALPIHPDAIVLAKQTGQSPLHHALHDGEDHELLFTATGDADLPGAVRIGRMVTGDAIELETANQRQSLIAGGWEHSL